MFLPDPYHLAHQDVKVFPAAAVIDVRYTQNVIASNSRSRRRGDALFL